MNSGHCFGKGGPPRFKAGDRKLIHRLAKDASRWKRNTGKRKLDRSRRQFPAARSGPEGPIKFVLLYGGVGATGAPPSVATDRPASGQMRQAGRFPLMARQPKTQHTGSIETGTRHAQYVLAGRQYREGRDPLHNWFYLDIYNAPAHQYREYTSRQESRDGINIHGSPNACRRHLPRWRRLPAEAKPVMPDRPAHQRGAGRRRHPAHQPRGPRTRPASRPAPCRLPCGTRRCANRPGRGSAGSSARRQCPAGG